MNGNPNTFSESIRDTHLRVKVIGLGGAGTNTVDRMRLDQIEGVHLAVVNTDAQALASSPVAEKVQVGRKVTFGMGCAGDIEVGLKAATADRDHLSRLTDGMDLVFLIVGLGGGAGSGCASLVAEMARANGALVITFAILPFTFEGEKRRGVAEEVLGRLNQQSDALISLPNDLLFQKGGGVLEAFGQSDEWIRRGIHSICSMLFQTGLINLDFATLKKAFPGPGGKTLFAVGRGEGPQCVEAALEDLASCPLLHLPKKSGQADSLLVNILGGADLEMSQIQTIMDQLTKRFGSRDQTVFGAVIDDERRQSLELCVLGMTDMDSRRYLPGAGAKPTSEATLPVIEAEPDLPVSSSRPLKSEKAEQAEFEILVQPDDRGFFRETEAYRFQGEDLDIPTFLRRGIKIPASERHG